MSAPAIASLEREEMPLSGECTRKGIFPFLALPRELRDNIYEYATTYLPHTDNDPDPVQFNRTLTDPGTFPRFTGLTLVCRQIHKEYSSCHPGSPALSIRLGDLDNYVSTFSASTIPIAADRRLHVHVSDGKEKSEPVNILPLLKWSLCDPRVQIVFTPWADVNTRARDLNMLFNPTYLTHGDAYALFKLRTVESALQGTLVYTTATLPDVSGEIEDEVFIIDSIPVCEHSGKSQSHPKLKISFDAADERPWMDGEWRYISLFTTLIAGLENGTIPPEYISEEDAQRIAFVKEAGLDKMQREWDLSLTVARKGESKGFTEDEARRGWVWQDEGQDEDDTGSQDGSQGGDENAVAKEAQDEDDDGWDDDDEAWSEQHYRDVDEEPCSEDEEEDDIGEEVREELSWLQQNRGS